VCPARAVGAPLSPRDVILSLREFANKTLESAVLPAAAELGRAWQGPGQVVDGDIVGRRTCMACVEVCPVALRHTHHRADGRKLVEDGQMDPQLKKDTADHTQDGNSFGESKRKRRRMDQVAALSG